MTLHAAVIRHLLFEDLGSFEPVLRAAGWDIVYRDAGVDDLTGPSLEDADLLVVLGGPIGAYEDAAYPFLAQELGLLERRIARQRPTLGICLGSQLIARALGSAVYPAGGKEIGWAPVQLTQAGAAGPLAHLDGIDVLHWHGDTFDLPQGATLLASTSFCRNQAFSLGPNLLALQFHPEAVAESFERWLIGHACELAAAQIDPAVLRKAAQSAAPVLESRGPRMLQEWLAGLQL